MKKIIISAFLASCLSPSTHAALKPGDIAPDFDIQAALAGKTFQYSLKEHLKNGPVVVYFYPSAYTKGCNVQAHGFSVNSDKFAAAGASVVGVSLDDITRLKEFSADPDYCAGKLAVASDADGNVAKAFDLGVREAAAGKLDSRGVSIAHGLAERTTFVITPDGKVAAAIGGLAAEQNVKQTLEFVQGLSAAKK